MYDCIDSYIEQNNCYTTPLLTSFYFPSPHLTSLLYFTLLPAGSIAGAVAAALTNPLDVIKTRLQTQNLEPCPTPVPGAIPIITKTKAAGARPGVGNFTGSAGNVHFYSNIPSSTIANLHPTQTTTTDNSVRTFTTSTIASSSNSTKGNMNVEEPRKIKEGFKSAVQVMRHMIREEGYIGFLRGLTPRMMLHAPAVAISWTTYETVKSLIA